MTSAKILCIIIGLELGFVFGGGSFAPAELICSTSFRYDNVYDDGNPKTRGNEFTIPVGIAYRRERFSLSLETAYSTASVKTGAEMDSGLDGMTDLLLSASYVYPFPDRPMSLIAGMDVNLPTGREQLSEEESVAEWGKMNDLFEVDDFGTGLNVGLSLGLMRQIRKNMVVVLQGAYIFNGEFDPTEEVRGDNFEPGNQLLMLGLLEWQATSWFKLNTELSYAHFGADTTNGEEYFRQGDQLGLGANIQVTRDPMKLFVGVQSMFSQKSEIVQDGSLNQESINSAGKNMFALAVLTYKFSPAISVWLQEDIRYYGESDFKDEQSGLPFSGKRARYAVGPGWSYQISENLSWYGSLKVFNMTQNRDVFVNKDVTYGGLNVELGFTLVL